MKESCQLFKDALEEAGRGKRHSGLNPRLKILSVIDGQKKPLDEDWWLQKFTRRRARSMWSEINRKNAMRLIAEGKMMPPGLAEVARAKGDGRWAAAYAAQSRAAVPHDLADALAANDRAAAFFASLDAANRYALVFRVHAAKKPEIRARRIARFVDMLANHQKLHP